MKTNFYLKDNHSKGLTLINLFVSFSDVRMKFSTGQSIAPKHWNFTEQQAKKSLTGYTDLNNYLKALADYATKSQRKYLTDGINLTVQALRKELDNFLNKKVEKKKDFESYYNDFVEDKTPLLKQRTVWKYKRLLIELKEFGKQSKIDLSFQSMDLNFYNKFKAFFIKQGKADSTTNKHIIILKTFLQWAHSMGYNTNLFFVKNFKTVSSEKPVIVLTNAELFHLSNYDFANNGKLDRIRDLYCFSAFTGLRFSDVQAIKKANVIEGQIHLTNVKTNNVNIIPLIPFAKSILEKYNYQLPKISNVKANLHIKDACKVAGINSPVTKPLISGGKDKNKDKELLKYQIITFHTARKTHITLSLQRGMRPEVVMSNVSHSDYKTFKKYINVSDAMKITESQTAWSTETINPKQLKRVV